MTVHVTPKEQMAARDAAMQALIFRMMATGAHLKI